MNKKTYFMFVHKNDDGLWCQFPDLDIATQSLDGTLESLMKEASDCLESYFMSEKNSQNIIEPSSFEMLQVKAKDCCDIVDFIAPVNVYLPSEPARINVTSTANKIAEITDFAKKIKKTRSEFMVDATLEYIRTHA